MNGESIPFSVTGLSDGDSCLLNIALDEANLTVTLTGDVLDASGNLGGADFTASVTCAVGSADGPLWLPSGTEVTPVQ